MSTENPTSTANRHYITSLVVSMVIYMVVLFPSIWLLQRGLEGPLKFVVALAPAVPIVFVAIALLRYFRGTDEFERQRMLESLGIAGLITALLAVTYGFLENAGLPHLSAWWTWTAFMVSWLIGRVIVSRSYNV